jgi:hypothetical protein
MATFVLSSQIHERQAMYTANPSANSPSHEIFDNEIVGTGTKTNSTNVLKKR